MIKPDDYYGSEQHFKDIQSAPRSCGYIEHPKTLSDCRHNFKLSLKELGQALWFFIFMDKIIIAIGKLLLKLGFKNES